MPEFLYTPQKLEVRVSPFRSGTSIINQLVWNNQFRITEAHDGIIKAYMDLIIIPYSYDTTQEDNWGSCLHNIGSHRNRDAQLIADDDTLVEVSDNPDDPTFGRILCIKDRSIFGEGLTWEEERAYIETQFPGQYMAQGKFHGYVRDNIPSLMGRELRKHILQADLGGSFTIGSDVLAPIGRPTKG